VREQPVHGVSADNKCSEVRGDCRGDCGKSTAGSSNTPAVCARGPTRGRGSRRL